MQKEKVRQNLIEATKQLLRESQAPEEITSRQISAKAGTNLSMINYCFESKDELLNIAIGQIIMESAGNPTHSNNTDVPPLKRLYHMLWELCELVLKFQRFTKISVPYILLQCKIEAPLYILPIIREYFGDRKNETECRIIAYQLISFMQLVFYRSDEFGRYCGVDIMNKSELKSTLELELNLLFNGGNDYDYE